MSFSTNINDVLGKKELDRQAEELLAEILKILSLKQEEFIDDSRKAIENITDFIQIVPHLDQFKKGKDKIINYLLDMGKSIRIAQLPGIPPGYVDDLDIAKINYETILLQLISVFKRPDARIITDLGMSIKKSEGKYQRHKKSSTNESGIDRVV